MPLALYPRPQVLSALPRGRHAVIEASAGTGKTYTLEHLIVELLLTTDTTLDQMLVVTFTEKATGELRSRVRAKLEELVDLPPVTTPPDHLHTACHWIIDDQARGKLAHALSTLDLATICTIHAFCQRLLGEHAFLHRRLLVQEQVPSLEAFSRSFRDTLRHRLAKEERPGRFVSAALRSGLAVPKLAEVLHAVARERGERFPKYDPERLQAALGAFPEEPFDERELVLELKAAKVNAQTAPAVARRLTKLREVARRARESGDLATFLSDLQVLESETQGGFLGYLVEKMGGRLLPDGTALRFQEGVRSLGEAVVPFTAALASELLPATLEDLWRSKAERGLVDFDDMLTLVREGLEGPHGMELVRLVRARYRYALIDEFQDTDETQWAIFRKLFFERAGENTLYLIGDPKQAIYGFRGADVHVYLAARQCIEDAGGALVALQANHRSTAKMIDACNLILDQQGAPPFFTGDIRYDTPVRCGNPGLTSFRGQVELPPIHLFSLDDAENMRGAARTLVRLIAIEVRALLGARPIELCAAGKRRRVRASDIFVLTRTEREGREVGEALRAHGVPRAFYKQEGLFSGEEAMHVLDLLAGIDEPEDRSKRFRAWLTPFFGLSLEELRQAADVPDHHPLIARLSRWNRLAGSMNYGALFSRIIEESGVIRRELFFRDSERELTNYLHLFELLAEEAGRGRMPLRELWFLLKSFVDGRAVPKSPSASSGDLQRLETDRDAVQIMTIHKSKGLEADVVFLVGGFSRSNGRQVVHAFHEDGRRKAWMGRPPAAIKEAVNAEAAREDERLYYVALTRARARLYLPYFSKGNLAGGYGCVNRRLQAIMGTGHAWEGLFSSENVPMNGPEAGAKDVPSLADWVPPSGLLDEPALPSFQQAKLRHRGFVVTSYSRLRDGPPVRQGPRVPAAQADPLPASDLPGGATTGIFLHELFETVDLGTLASAPSFDAWYSLPQVNRLIEEVAQRNGVKRTHGPRAAEIAYRALTTPVAAGNHIIPPISRLKTLREMEFLYPSGTDRFIKGFVDLVFEHEGLVYIADWKSDLLPSWDRETIRRHVDEHYVLQVRLYSLALVKVLGARSRGDHDARFGGMFYFFVRGMDASGAGVDFRRPTWSEITEWEMDLAGRKS
ncbi:MAG: UvrD-helicase domain-containing protein [Deltaproteobacteria bacterium]|nr:UvrD-helicase domain-containing protein [Deltaproteobacteria bacterium]